MFFMTVTRGWMELHMCFLINRAEDPRFKETRTCEEAKQVSKQVEG